MISTSKTKAHQTTNPLISKFQIRSIILGAGMLLSLSGPLPAYAQEDDGFRAGNGFYGNEQCGELTCAPDEVCQKTFGGFDESDVLPPNEPPSGEQNTNDEGDGDDSNTIDDGSIYNDVQYRCVEPPEIDGPDSDNNKYRVDGSDDGYNNANLFTEGQDDPGVPVNIINQDALPVDIFNPNPIPTHITSPNPIPVTVVDDLALYQQKELIDKPLANKQKQATISEVNKQVREDINEQNLVQTPADLKAKGVESGAFDSTTGSLSIAERKFANSFARPDIENLREDFQIAQDITKGGGAEALPDPSFEEMPNCNPEDGDLDDQGLDCALAGLKPENNAYDQTVALRKLTQAKVGQAQENLQQEQQAGDGFLAKSKDGDKNPFTKTITSPGQSIAGVVEKTLNASIDQSIVSSDRCFSSVPGAVKEGTLNPLLRNGLFNKPEESDFEQVFQNIYNTILSAISCEVENEVSSIFEDIFDDGGGDGDTRSNRLDARENDASNSSSDTSNSSDN